MCAGKKKNNTQIGKKGPTQGKSLQGPVKSFQCVKKTGTGPPPPGDQGIKSVECTRKADNGLTSPGDQAVKSVECSRQPETTPGNGVNEPKIISQHVKLGNEPLSP